MSGPKTAFVTIKAKGRDFGKKYLLTEMPAARSEKWAMRSFLALARGGLDIPEDIAESGLWGIATMGFKIFGSMKWEDAEPLLDEMFTCIQAVPTPSDESVVTELFEGSISEIATRIYLRKQVFGLHVDFSQLAALYNSAKAASQSAALPNT